MFLMCVFVCVCFKMNIGNDEFHLRYYNQDDIPNVLQVLYESMQHRPIFHDIYQMKESVKKLNIHMSSQVSMKSCP